MSIVNQIQTRFYKTPIFKGLIGNYAKDQKVSIVPKKQLQEMAKISQDKLELEKSLPMLIETKVQEEVSKVEMLYKNEARRYRVPFGFNQYTNPDRKPGSDLPFSYLRRMALVYPIARACINRRIRQITQLEWDITTIDEIEEETGYEAKIKTVKEFLKQPMGHKTRMRELLTIMVDDLLTIDAVCFEYQKTRGGGFMNLIPIDPTTIALRVTETGGTPMPPETAYVQIIQGEKIGEFTTDEMLYDFMNTRSYTPYGLSPLESLIIQVESALRGGLYNLNYLRENNVPEGFIELPEDVASSKDRVEEWQVWFDAMVAGDPRFMHRLKILPAGSKYTAAKKPEDMAFERFELWMLQQTCAMFEVQPQDIGVTYQVNKATGESQSNLAAERGLIPLGNFIKEIFDSIIQTEYGMPELQFIWRNINPVDRKEEAEIAEKEIKMGSRSVDEYRADQGLEPLGLGHYIDTSSGPMLVEDIIAGKVGPRQNAEQQAKQTENDQNKPNNPTEDPEDDTKEKLMYQDIRRWKKAVFNDLEKGRKIRTKFPSEHIDSQTHEDIANALAKVNSRLAAKLLFDQYLDPEVKASMTLLKFSEQLRQIEHDVASA